MNTCMDVLCAGGVKISNGAIRVHKITRANGFKSTRCFYNITDNYVMQLYRIRSNKI